MTTLFPVLIDERITHVVWVLAEDQADAVRQAKADPAHLDECLGPKTRADVELAFTAPEDDWEHRLVKEPSTFGYPGETAAVA